MRRIGQNASSDSLFFLTPLSPLGEGYFEVKQLRRSRNLSENKYLIKELKISGVGVEHLYITYDNDSGCKFVNGPSVVKKPYDVKNIIACTPFSKVDTLKLFWESQSI